MPHASNCRARGERCRQRNQCSDSSLDVIGSLEQVIFRMDCLQTWLSRGVAVHNPPRSLEVAIDKWLCLQRLNEVGVPVPCHHLLSISPRGHVRLLKCLVATFWSSQFLVARGVASCRANNKIARLANLRYTAAIGTSPVCATIPRTFWLRYSSAVCGR